MRKLQKRTNKTTTNSKRERTDQLWLPEKRVAGGEAKGVKGVNCVEVDSNYFGG